MKQKMNYFILSVQWFHESQRITNTIQNAILNRELRLKTIISFMSLILAYILDGQYRAIHHTSVLNTCEVRPRRLARYVRLG